MTGETFPLLLDLVDTGSFASSISPLSERMSTGQLSHLS